MDSVISSPNLVKFSTYSKNGPGFGFSHFLAPIPTPLLQNLFGNFVVVVLYFTLFFAEIISNVLLAVTSVQSILSSGHIYISPEIAFLLNHFLTAVFNWAFLKV